MGRRERIADAGIRLVATGGPHALTHLKVDAEAGLPRGSTSYYARTRRDLVRLVALRLSEGSHNDVAELDIPDAMSRDEAASLVLGVMESMAARRPAQAARFWLMFELREDPELRRALSTTAPVRAPLIRLAEALLGSCGVEDPTVHAPNLVGLVDALLMYRTADAPVDVGSVLRAYMAGLD